MALFVIFWLPLCLLGYEWLTRTFSVFASSPLIRTCLLVLIGLLTPQAAKLKNAILTPRTAKYLSFLQFIDENTRLYVSRIINREERKINTICMEVDGERRRRALDRLFEEHNIEIARVEAKKRQPPEMALGLFKVRHPAVKFKYLLHYLGYTECLRAVRKVAENPEVILPSWPSGQGDRRSTGRSLNDTTEVLSLSGRRKYEQAHIRAYVLDVAGATVRKKYQVFLSSTYLDLKEERQQALRGLLGADCIPAGMEFFPSSDEELWSLIRGVVDECDYYVLLIGGRYGSTTTDGVSYTESEYDYAVRTGKPVLPFLQSAPALIAGIEDESPEKKTRLAAFKGRVATKHAPGFWGRPEDLPFLVQQAIEKVKRTRPAVGWIRPERTEG
jgi:uncharacterized protein DUF4062